MIPYELTVVTGNVKEAGTDQVITLTVFGSNGKSAPIVLDKLGDRFERGREDLIKVEALFCLIYFEHCLTCHKYQICSPKYLIRGDCDSKIVKSDNITCYPLLIYIHVYMYYTMAICFVIFVFVI